MFSLKARVYPMGIFFLPIIILGIAYSFQFDRITEVLSSLGLTTLLVYFLSHLGRDLGKKKEAYLWNYWGGAPTSQVLSYSNSILDDITKEKYHTKLMKLSPVMEQLDKIFEQNNPKIAFNIYKSWTIFLISKTRNTEEFPLLFKELINYNFRRNLWGLKPIAIAIIIFALIGNLIYQMILYGLNEFANYTSEFYISEIIILILLLLWIFVITKNWIRVTAFAYAERLIESINSF